MNTKIKVLHAAFSELYPNAMFDLMVGNPSNVPYREVVTLTAEEIGVADYATVDELLGTTWRTMNCVEGDPETEVCVRLKVRSMMVGDRVVIEREGHATTYQCAPVGWKTVEAA